MKSARKTFSVAALAAGVGAAMVVRGLIKRAADAEAAHPPSGQFVNVAGSNVHYLQGGKGPNVILLHGAGGNLRDFSFGLMQRLTDNYTVTAFDRPGLGYTDRVPGVSTHATATAGESPVQQAAMLRDAALALGIENPVVVGHSFGGIVAYAWSLLGLDAPSPVNAQAVVSLAGIAMPWPGDLGLYYRVNGTAFGGVVTIPILSAFVTDTLIRDRIESTFAPQPAPDGYADHIGPRLTLRTPNFRANIRQVNTLRPHVVEMVKRYPELSLPIEIVHGDADETVPINIHSEELIKLVPSASLVRLNGVGHMPHHVDPNEAIAAINRAAARAGLR